MHSSSSILIPLILFFLFIGCTRSEIEHPLKDKNYELVFEDHFDGKHLDTAKWQTFSTNPKPYDKVLPRFSCDYSNAEILLDENVEVKNGHLRLTASNNSYQYSGIVDGECNAIIGCGFQGCDSFHLNLNYTSGSIFAKKGYNHGYFECRAKIPSTEGLYPVFWLWHHDEIVVFEFFGAPKNHYLSLHNKDKARSGNFKKVNDYSKDFHTYSVEWTPYHVSWYFNYRLLKSEYRYLDKKTEKGIPKKHFKENGDYVLNESFPDSIDRWLMPNISLRVYEWSDNIDVKSLPDQLIIDYIKVYQQKR